MLEQAGGRAVPHLRFDRRHRRPVRLGPPGGNRQGQAVTALPGALGCVAHSAASSARRASRV